MNRFSRASVLVVALMTMVAAVACTQPPGPGPDPTTPTTSGPAPTTGPVTPTPTTAPPAGGARTTFTNPIRRTKGADPWIAVHNGEYYLIATSWTSVLTIRRSPTLAGLATAPSVVVWSDADASRCCNIWAPELHRFNGRWYLYYTAGRNTSDYIPTQRLHVLESAGDDPLGPYTYKNRLYDASADNAFIDGSVLALNGRQYLLGSTLGNPQVMSIMAMTNPYTVTGRKVTLSTPTYGWERQGGTVNEAPVALQHGGRTFIVYSASACSGPDYKLGLLTYRGSGDPMSTGSWAKAPNPVFSRSDANGVYAPGHNGFFTSPDGTESWIVYHANSSASGACDNNRTTRAQKFTWNADGTPNFGPPVRLGTPLASPSGERAPTPKGYAIVNRSSGRCLDVTGGSGDGADVRQTTCDGRATQRWNVENLTGEDVSRITNAGTGKALDITDCSAADGTNVRQWSWLDNNCQRFRPEIAATGGWVRLASVASRKVLDVADCSAADNADVRQWSPNGALCQQWQFRPV
jgi:GH43 family beta-xylosidase